MIKWVAAAAVFKLPVLCITQYACMCGSDGRQAGKQTDRLLGMDDDVCFVTNTMQVSS